MYTKFEFCYVLWTVKSYIHFWKFIRTINYAPLSFIIWLLQIIYEITLVRIKSWIVPSTTLLPIVSKSTNAFNERLLNSVISIEASLVLGHAQYLWRCLNLHLCKTCVILNVHLGQHEVGGVGNGVGSSDVSWTTLESDLAAEGKGCEEMQKQHIY